MNQLITSEFSVSNYYTLVEVQDILINYLILNNISIDVFSYIFQMLKNKFYEFDITENGRISDRDFEKIFINIEPSNIYNTIYELCYENKIELDYKKMLIFLQDALNVSDYEQIQYLILKINIEYDKLLPIFSKLNENNNDTIINYNDFVNTLIEYIQNRSYLVLVNNIYNIFNVGYGVDYVEFIESLSILF